MFKKLKELKNVIGVISIALSFMYSTEVLAETLSNVSVTADVQNVLNNRLRACEDQANCGSNTSTATYQSCVEKYKNTQAYKKCAKAAYEFAQNWQNDRAEDAAYKEKYNVEEKDETVDGKSTTTVTVTDPSYKEPTTTAEKIGSAKDDWAETVQANNYENEETQKTIAACLANPNSAECKARNPEGKSVTQLRKEYNEQVKKQQEDLEKQKEAIEEAQKAYDKEYSKNLKNAQKKLDDAQDDIDKYCTEGSKNYNADSCSKAQQQKAESEKTIADLNADRAMTQQGALQAAGQAEYDAQKEAAASETAAKNEQARQASRDKIDAAEKAKEEAQAAYEKAAAACGKNDSECLKKAAATRDEAIKKADEEIAAAQEEISTSYGSSQSEVQASSDKYNEAKTKFNTAQKCKAAPSQCTNEDKALLGISDTSEINDEMLKELRENADDAYAAYKRTTNNSATAAIQKEYDQANTERTNIQNELASLNEQLKIAQEACEKNSTLTSKSGQAAAQEACSKAAQLEEQIAQKEQELEDVQNRMDSLSSDLGAALDSSGQNHEGQYYAAFEGSGLGSYEATGDIFHALSMRAFYFLFHIKKILYVFAGFGLIAFAWMAVFGKLSFKWFANIGIGLFLIANMGRFIEYFVFPNTCENGFCTGPQYAAGSLSYGDNLSTGMGDSTYAWVDESALYVPPSDASIEGQLQDGEETPEYKEDARGFCGGTAGASFLTNFTSCVKDITEAGKKAVNAVNTAKQTINSVKSTVDMVGNAAGNVADAVGKITSGDISSLGDITNALGEIGSNVNNAIGAIGGVTNNIINNASSISNDIQDVTKSTDEVAELEEKRSKGEGTNALDRFLKGQTVGADGEVEHVQELKYDKNGNVIGSSDTVASDDNIVSQVQDFVDAVEETSKNINSSVQTNTKNATYLLDTAGDVTGLNDKLEDNQRKNNEKKAQQAAEEQANQSWVKQQEAEQKRQQEAAAEEAQKTAAEKSIDSAKTAVANAKEAQSEYQSALQNATNKENAYQKAQEEAQKKAQTVSDLEQKKADACSGENITSNACKLATGRYNVAKSEAESATRKANEAKAAREEANQRLEAAKEPLQGLADSARQESKKAAEQVQKEAAATIKVLEGNANTQGSVAYEQKEAEKLSEELDTALADYEAKKEKALESKSQKDIAAARAAQEAYQEKQKAYTEQSKKAQEAEKALEEEKKKLQEAQDFVVKMDAELNYGYAQKNYDVIDPDSKTEAEIAAEEKAAEQQRKQEEAEAEKLRQQYLTSQNIVNQANQANSAAEQAKSKANQAANQAEQKERQAQEAQKKAEEAAKEAASSRDPVAIRAAEQAQKRAELAAKEAQAARLAAQEAEKPVEDLQEKARQASIAEVKYLQQVSQEQKAKAEDDLQQYRNMAAEKSKEIEAAKKNLEELTATAKQDGSTENILAANKAYQDLIQKQQEASEIQKNIDAAIKDSKTAEMNYYEYKTRQAELENPESPYNSNNSTTVVDKTTSINRSAPLATSEKDTTQEPATQSMASAYAAATRAKSSGTFSTGNTNNSSSEGNLGTFSTGNTNNSSSEGNLGTFSTGNTNNSSSEGNLGTFSTGNTNNSSSEGNLGTFSTGNSNNTSEDDNLGNLAVGDTNNTSDDENLGDFSTGNTDNGDGSDGNITSDDEENTTKTYRPYNTPKKVFSSWSGRSAVSRSYSSGRYTSRIGTNVSYSVGSRTYANTGKGSASDTASRAQQYQMKEKAKEMALQRIAASNQEAVERQIWQEEVKAGNEEIEERLRQKDRDADRENEIARQKRRAQIQRLREASAADKKQDLVLTNESGAPVLDKNGNQIPVSIDQNGNPEYDAEGNPVPLLTDNQGNILYGDDGKPIKGKISEIVAP